MSQNESGNVPDVLSKMSALSLMTFLTLIFKKEDSLRPARTHGIYAAGGPGKPYAVVVQASRTEQTFSAETVSKRLVGNMKTNEHLRGNKLYKGLQKHKAINASLTVEAALAFPVFFFALMALCVFFLYMETNHMVNESMLETARNLSAYGDIIRSLKDKNSTLSEDVTESTIGGLKAGTEGGITVGLTAGSNADNSIAGTAESETAGMIVRQLSSWVTQLEDAAVMRLFLEEELAGRTATDTTGGLSAIRGGRAGIDCIGSELMTDSDELILCCNYTLRTPVSMFGLGGIQVSQSLNYRYFTGYQVESLLEAAEATDTETAAEDTTVYITETGRVYHVSLNCPSLRLVIRAVEADKVADERNAAGGRYYPCEKCAHGSEPELLYITEDGDRYHYESSCSGLKRTISEVKLSELTGRRACKRCAGKQSEAEQ